MHPGKRIASSCITHPCHYRNYPYYIGNYPYYIGHYPYYIRLGPEGARREGAVVGTHAHRPAELLFQESRVDSLRCNQIRFNSMGYWVRLHRITSWFRV